MSPFLKVVLTIFLKDIPISFDLRWRILARSSSIVRVVRTFSSSHITT
jgi:hypothetical protein